jgi:FKBP-type peptidyl-prolyl cis-trans isomerase
MKIPGGLKMTFNHSAPLLLLSLLLLSSCHNDGINNAGQKPGREDIEGMNRYMVQKDRERIRSYSERKGLKMTETSTGLWFQIIREGDGANLAEGSSLTMEYECSLLDGTLCYTSREKGPRQIILGRTPVEPGLNEGLRLLKYGSEAIFILPPYMAYGLPGDGKMIPPRSILVYKVHILRP